MKALQKIEKLLNIKLEKKLYGEDYDPNQKNTYSIRGEYIESLRLDNVEIDDFSKLFPHLKKLRSLEIINSTIPNFSGLLKVNYGDLRLNNVVIKSNDCDEIGNLPWHMKFYNMKFDAACLRCFEKSNIKGFKQVEFLNCHIDNIQYLDDIQPVSLMILNKITFTYKPKKKTTKKKTRRLSISNSKFKDVSFIPFKDSLVGIEFENCRIGSLSGLTKLPKLTGITIDSDTKVKDKTVQKNAGKRKISGALAQGEKPLDVGVFTPLKNYIDELSINGFKGETIDSIGELEKVKHLSFYDCNIYIDAFLPIAKQIKSISFTKSKIKNHSYFSHFKKLTCFEIKNFDDDKCGLRSFEKILPLKNQLKELEICDFEKIKDLDLIPEFKALESLKYEYDIPLKAARHVMTLKNLKRLALSVEYKKKRTLDLGKLKNLEYLILETDINFTGFENLKQLKSLKIGADMADAGVDINLLPQMKKLKRLNLTSYHSKIKGLEQLSNLEYLRLKGCPKIKLGKLNKLKVLDMENSGVTDFSKFKELPNLEGLDVSSMYNDLSLKGIHKFPNLKLLTVAESDIKDITDLKPLKKLKYLDLYYTGISDVSVLNTLPNLKEVNLATYTNNDLEGQLDKPEIAVYCGLPTIYLSIWREDEFGV